MKINIYKKNTEIYRKCKNKINVKYEQNYNSRLMILINDINDTLLGTPC